MSVQKVTKVTKARKDQGKCGKCGTELPAGSGYLWWPAGFRSRMKHKRCLAQACYPRPSERETSLAATALAAEEAFSDQVNDMATPEDIRTAVEEVAEAVREVADQYREAADAWENGNEEAEERADIWETAADDLEGWDPSTEPETDERPEEGCEHHGAEPDGDCDECDEASRAAEAWDEALETMREDATEAVGEGVSPW